ncbi:MAG: hypothetical protein AAGI11_15540 [Pseudomonadota bacterium]
MAIAIWGAALVLYLAFRLWYDGIRKPLTAEEVEEFTHHLEQRAEHGADKQDIAVLRKFMEEDDGKEFIMVNLVQFNPSPVEHPDTGQGVKAQELLLEYFKPLMKLFLRRAGHPVLSTRVVGGYMDAWNTPPNPGWHVAGLIRYRSRRDAMLATMADAEFDHIHKYKAAALRQTFAIPAQKSMGLYASPRVTLALVLALAAALLQLALA